MPITAADYRASAVLLAMFVGAMGISVLFAEPFKNAGIKVFENPENGWNVLWYALLLFGFTALILYLRRWKWAIQAVILLAVASTIAYVAFFLLYVTVGWSDTLSAVVAAAAALAATAALYWHPEWYVVDLVGLLVAGATAAMFGISLDVLWVIVLLVGLAIYDAIAVYRTKHMLSLADAVIDLRLPVLLVIPKHRGYRFRKETVKVREAKPENKGAREAMFMGLGDLVMPSVLVVSALAFGPFAHSAYNDNIHLFDAQVHDEHARFDAFAGAYGAAPLKMPGLLTYVDPQTGIAYGSYVHALQDHVKANAPPANATAAQKAMYADHLANATQLVDTYDANFAAPPTGWWWGYFPAAGAAIGTLVGYAVLMGFVLRGNPQAGLPLLNGGAIVGFLTGLLWATHSVRFW